MILNQKIYLSIQFVHIGLKTDFIYIIYSFEMSSRRRSRSRDRKNVPSKLRMDNNSPAVRITGKTLFAGTFFRLKTFNLSYINNMLNFKFLK